KFDFDTVVADTAINRKTKFHMWSKRRVVECISSLAQIFDHRLKISFDEVGQKETVVEACTPSNRPLVIRILPELGYNPAHEELLSETHPRMRRHLERTHLDETEPSCRAVRRIQLVDAEFRAMCVACDIHKKITKDSIDQPWRAFGATCTVDETERHLQFV